MSAVEPIRDRSICSRRERRYKTSEDKLLRCETAVEEGGLRLGHVLDLSSTGIRLICDGQFEVGQTIHTLLHTDRPQGLYKATIRRVEPWVDGKSVLGCSLNNRIPDSVLEDLAAEGVVNRRSDDRYVLDQVATVSWQLNPGEVDVRLQDYSYGGMRVESPIALPDDAHLRIRIEWADEDLVLEGKAVWQRPSTDGFWAGIAFTNREAAATVTQLGQQPIERSSVELPIRVLRRIAVAAGAAAACYLSTTI